MIAGLEAALAVGAARVTARMDSKLVVEQMSGRWKVKHAAMKPLAARAAELVAKFDRVDFERGGPFAVLLQGPGPTDTDLPELDPHQH